MTQYGGSDSELTALGALLRDVQLGKASLSKQSLRRLQEDLDRAMKHEEKKRRPKSKKQGWTMYSRAMSRKRDKKRRERNPNDEYRLNRRYTRLLKHCRERGLECSISLAEFEVLLDGVTPEDRIRLVRRDPSKGYSLENTVVMNREIYFKKYLPLLNRKSED